MSTAPAHAPALRLVNNRDDLIAPALPRGHSAVRRVTSENRAASTIEPRDARWVLAVRTAGVLQGGRAAILRPESRRSLVSFALSMGLRPFDASLVIAIVQDAARAGLPTLGALTEERLLMVHAGPLASDRRGSPGTLLAIAAGLGAAVFGLLLLWIRKA